MINNFRAKIPAEDRKAFIRTIFTESFARGRIVVMALALLQTVQVLIYISKKDSILYDKELILIKLFIIVFCILSFIGFTLINRENSRIKPFAEPIMMVDIFIIICWSIVNTFKAQSITSDISIYILVLFTIAAIVRFRPWLAIAVFGISYLIFLIGIPRFQLNREYLTSHIMNGLILNIIAYLISYMMYCYSFAEFQDRQKVNIKNAELLHLSRHDGLTSLYNHLTIYELLECAISQAGESLEALSIMLIDLDHFKELNDIYGHRAGDTILREVSKSIVSNIRQNDMAGRYGGDEFLIILPGSSTNNTKEIAFQLLNEIRQLDFNGMTLSFSCGIAQWNGETAEQFVDKADKVLYRVKSDGRNNVYA